MLNLKPAKKNTIRYGKSGKFQVTVIPEEELTPEEVDGKTNPKVAFKVETKTAKETCEKILPV